MIGNSNLRLCSVPEGIPDPVVLALTTKEAAKVLSMSPKNLRERTQSGEIKARVWIDGNHRYYYFDLVEWMEIHDLRRYRATVVGNIRADPTASGSSAWPRGSGCDERTLCTEPEARPGQASAEGH